MNNTFNEKSRQIADSFLQTVVLIDDQAYKSNSDDPHDLNSVEITRNFAMNHKLCSIYQPENATDIEYLVKVAKKADVVILDWKLHLKSETDDLDNDEEVVEDQDPRGEYTLRIIDNILSDPEPSMSGLKLILIYTGETDLLGIAQIVHSRLKESHNPEIIDFDVLSANFKISVIGKPTLQVTHIPEIQGRIVSYKKLPTFILDEFTKITSGLISDFVINALCIIRSNTSRLLQLYSRKLDPALLAHCALLPDHNDAHEQLVEMLTNSVSALLNYNKAGETISIERIKKWIDSQPLEAHLKTLEIKLDGVADRIKVDKKFLKLWVAKDFDQVCQISWENMKGSAPSNTVKEKIRKVERSIHHEATKYFTPESNFQKSDCDFSILSHQKSNLRQPSLVPKLSLGSIVKKETGKDIGYYVCIQQKCDSVRVTDKSRKFLFLPLKEVSSSQSFHFVIESSSNYIYLKANFKIYNLYFANFRPSGKTEVIKAKFEKNSEVYYFQSTAGRFTWLSDLKDAHAQRLSNLFAGQLSRVGLDESEWLRRWAGL